MSEKADNPSIILERRGRKGEGEKEEGKKASKLRPWSGVSRGKRARRNLSSVRRRALFPPDLNSIWKEGGRKEGRVDFCSPSSSSLSSYKKEKERRREACVLTI